MKYRKKPVVIDAVQFTEANKDISFNFITCTANPSFDEKNNPIIKIHTLEGVMIASLGDWIIRGVNGEFYPCKLGIFEKTYEAIDK